MLKYQKINWCLATILCLMLLLSLTACGKDSVCLVQEQSWFNDFSVSEDTVEFRCHLCIENETMKPQTVSLTGHFPEDMKAGLLKEEYLPASDPEVLQCTTFLLQPGTNTLDVVFIGTFDGNPMKQDRLLPEILIEIH